MNDKDSRRTGGNALRLLLLAALTLSAALAAAGPGAANDPPSLDGERLHSGFYPCPGQTDFTRAPDLSECTDTEPKVDVSTECNPTGVSTITITRTHTQNAFAFPVYPGTFEETITATIGPQTGPFVPEFQPLAGDGYRASSLGFRSGPLLSFTAEFEIQAGGTTITGTRTLTDNIANTGVCREFAGEAVGEHAFFPPTLELTGYFYVLNAQLLTYSATITDESGSTGVSGVGQTYLGHSYATSGEPLSVNSAVGTLLTEFGSTTPVVAPFEEATPTGSDVVVEPAPGVTLTFPSVTEGGTTSVTAILDIADVPAPPANIQVGDPPMLYDISTTATFTGEVLVCVPYGPLPDGMAPTLWHYDDGLGQWVDVTESFDVETKVVCGLVSSFSPFLVGYVPTGPDYTVTGPFQPVDALPTENVLQAGQTVPVKFSLGGDHGLDVFAEGFPTSVGAACGSTATDPVETTSNGAGLTFDASTGIYTYHWKTLKSWKGHCRTLTLTFADGDQLQAKFRFR